MEILNETLKRTGYEYDTLMNLLHVSVSKHILDEYYTWYGAMTTIMN